MRKIILDYLDCLEKADYDKLINLFVPDAIVYSPLYGEQDAKKFYKTLFLDTTESKIKLIDIFTNESHKSAVAYFHYDWTLNNNIMAQFDVVDVFEFNDALDKVVSLKIIYDTWQTRGKLNSWPNGTHVARVRVARPTQQLDALLRFYSEGLGLEVIASFKAHEGYDGVMLGLPQHQYHLEFTQHSDVISCSAPTRDNLLVFYFDNYNEITNLQQRLEILGYTQVKAENPYWFDKSITFEDPEGWRVVLCLNV